MKKKIHPIYKKNIANCSCGNIINIYSTIKSKLILDVCNLCHPFYTGQQKKINSGSRINKFNKKYNILIKK